MLSLDSFSYVLASNFTKMASYVPKAKLLVLFFVVENISRVTMEKKIQSNYHT